MKEILFGTTALIVAAYFHGSVSAAEKMSVGVSGYQQLYLLYGSQSDNAGEAATNLRNHGILKEGEVHFKASTTMDNGIKIGWEAEMEAESSAGSRTADENFIWLEGDFGRVTLGGIWGPSLLLSHNAPNAAPGWGVFLPLSPATHPGAGSTVSTPNSYAVISAKDDKITYTTPELGEGIRIGFAYTPDLGSGQNGNGGFTTDAGNDHGSTYEAAIELNTKLGPSSFGAYATYLRAKQEDTTTGADDRNAWAVGADLNVGKYTIGFGYKADDEGVTADSDEKHFGIGGSWKKGPFKIALNYISGTDDNGGGTNADEVTFMQLSSEYEWGPGVTLGAGIQNTKYEDGGSVVGNENNATVAFIGTALSF